MWKKNLLFLFLIVVGVGSLFGGLMKRERIRPEKRLPGSHEVSSAGQPELIAQVNAEFEALWRAKNIVPAEVADEHTVIRRLSLALIGTVPSIEELRSLEKVPQTERIDWWISYLLADPRYGNYVGERLARAYVGTEDGPFIVFRRRRFVTWLAEQLQKNKPYDEIVRQLIASDGIWTDTPAVNFISVSYDQDGAKVTDPVKLAARTSRAFLGHRIDCLQCHDDNLDVINFGTPEKPVAGQQHHFHELAAFFGRTNVSRRGISDVEKLSYKTKYLGEEQEHEVEARVPFGKEYFTSEGSPRQQLSRWVTHRENRAFARAAVNRLWAILFGRPLNPVIDNIPLQGELPPGLELLASDFIAHRYDLKRLISNIALTAPFRLDSAADFEITPEHENAWAVFPLTGLRPEQMSGSLIQSVRMGALNGDAHVLYRIMRFGQMNDFLKRYGDAGVDEFAEHGGTIPQRLLMMNGDLVQERTDQNIVLNASTRLALLAESDARAIKTAYLAVLTRTPKPRELEHFEKRFSNKQINRVDHLADLYWTLVNSTEFSWNH